jgi:hypothetical protein
LNLDFIVGISFFIFYNLKIYKRHGNNNVNKLRTATGAGMMDCKKALVEAEGF